MTQDEKIKQLADTIAMQQQELSKYKMQLRGLYGFMMRGEMPLWMPTESIQDDDLFSTMLEKIKEYRKKNGLHIEELDNEIWH